MKSLLLKDLYNISYNAKAMLLIMVIMTAAVVPTAGAIPQMAGFTILWAMMEVTTFTFDETSGWTAYALVLPLRRSDIVRAKFVVLAIFCTVGVLLGLAVSGAASFLMGGRLPEENGPLVLLVAVPVIWAIAFAMGSTSIPLAFRFGAENARILIVVAFVVPMVIFVGLAGALSLAGVTLSNGQAIALLCASPLAALAWGAVMYRISCAIFAKTEW